MTSFYSEKELLDIGLKSFGKNVLISRKASIYDAKNISIGNNVRIDDFCLLSGNIKIGNYVHISAFSALYGGNRIIIDDFVGISPRCSVFSVIDDFSGECAVGPMMPIDTRGLISGEVFLSKYVQLGANSIIFPNINLPEGLATGAFTLINKNNLDKWSIYGAVPAKKIKARSKKIIELTKYLND